MNYTLNISFNSSDLSNIYASNYQVALVKDSGSSQSASVAWACFRPLASNQVSYDNNRYSAYAASGNIMPGAIIRANTYMNLAAGQSTNYYQNSFSQPDTKSSLGSGQIFNRDSSSISAGLSLQGYINGSNLGSLPIGIQSLYSNMTVVFNPQEIIKVFLSSSSMNSMILSNIPSNAFTANFNSSANINICYNGNTGTFTQI